MAIFHASTYTYEHTKSLIALLKAECIDDTSDLAYRVHANARAGAKEWKV